MGEIQFFRFSRLLDEGVGFSKSGLQTLAVPGFFLSLGGARVESADFGTCLVGCGAVWALVLKIVLAPESKTEFWCLLFKLRVGFQWLFSMWCLAPTESFL